MGWVKHTREIMKSMDIPDDKIEATIKQVKLRLLIQKQERDIANFAKRRKNETKNNQI